MANGLGPFICERDFMAMFAVLDNYLLSYILPSFAYFRFKYLCLGFSIEYIELRCTCRYVLVVKVCYLSFIISVKMEISLFKLRINTVILFFVFVFCIQRNYIQLQL